MVYNLSDKSCVFLFRILCRILVDRHIGCKLRGVKHQYRTGGIVVFFVEPDIHDSFFAVRRAPVVGIQIRHSFGGKDHKKMI